MLCSLNSVKNVRQAGLLSAKLVKSNCISSFFVENIFYSKFLPNVAIKSQLNLIENFRVRHEVTPHRALKIYTKTGDRGNSSTYRGERFPKDDKIFEALGSIDELSAHLGMAKEFAHDKKHPYCDQLERIQCLLQDVGSTVAKAPLISDPSKLEATSPEIEMSNIEELETWIDHYTENLSELKNFILPGGGKASASLHIARTVCRRAERRLVTVAHHRQVDPNLISFINRLSDYLFTLARLASSLDKSKECIYISPQRRRPRPAVNVDTQTFSEV